MISLRKRRDGKAPTQCTPETISAKAQNYVIVNMGRTLALLCLLLSSIHATRHQLVSRVNPNSFTAKNGALYNFAFSSIPSMTTTSEWTVSIWIYVVSTPMTGMGLLLINNPYLGEYLSTARYLTVNGEWKGFLAAEGLPYGSWFHLILGSGSSQVFTVLTKRIGTQYNLVGAGSVTVSGATIFVGADDAMTFTVRDR